MKLAADNKGYLGVGKSLAIQRRLFRYLESGRIHPALLLSGAERDVKYSVAKGMAKHFLCKRKTQNGACLTCSSCERIEKEIHPDVLILRELEEDTIKIETIREFAYQMAVLPLEGERKICIIDECHRMNAAASNAFLKTLEEPAEGRFFILLTTQPGALIATVLSRVIEFHFKPEGEVLPLSLQEKAEMQSLLSQFLVTKDLSELNGIGEDKEKSLKWVQFLQAELREAAIASGTLKNIGRIPEKFFEVVEVEGRLRSNASPSLMIENLMRQYFT